ncbi:MAG: hypothetical protein ACLFSW_01750 [Halobacteriales archaeon]
MQNEALVGGPVGALAVVVSLHALNGLGYLSECVEAALLSE